MNLQVSFRSSTFFRATSAFEQGRLRVDCWRATDADQVRRLLDGKTLRFAEKVANSDGGGTAVVFTVGQCGCEEIDITTVQRPD